MWSTFNGQVLTTMHESINFHEGSASSSYVVDNGRHESSQHITQVLPSINKKRKIEFGSSLDSSLSKDVEEAKPKKQKKSDNHGENKEEKKSTNKANKNQKKVISDQMPPTTEYIHVRARRGQATDSHSLAERVRREKISERMKILQRLVPGCDKVNGKALVLDEIINYVQSLQKQVEYLSLKLASVNSLVNDFELDLGVLINPAELIRDDFVPDINVERLDQVTSPLPFLQQYQQQQPTAFAHPTFASPNNHICPFIDFPGDNGSVFWEMDDQNVLLM